MSHLRITGGGYDQGGVMTREDYVRTPNCLESEMSGSQSNTFQTWDVKLSYSDTIQSVLAVVVGGVA